MDPYKVLGIAPGATDEEIKRAYRNLSRKYHPDANVNNPDRAQAEEKFKEVQMAYDQIMKQKQQGYSYGSGYGGGGAYGYGGFGYGRTNGAYGNSGYGSSASGESVEMQAAANYIASRHYVEALNVLNGIPFGERRARWYYFSAIANQGMGNNINAMEHAKRAVEMEPSNMEYRQFLQHLQYGGTWYTSMGSDYDRLYASAGNWCLSLLCLDLLCNCCCFRPF